MKRFAAFANAGASHQMTMCAIGREIQKRGHDFRLFGTSFQAGQMRAPDIAFEVIGHERADPAERYFEAAKTGSLPISATVNYMTSMADLLCTRLPAALQEHQIDFLLADQEEPGAATSADLAQIPYASICNSLPLNESPDIPPGFLQWHYSRSPLAILRNRIGYAARNFVIRGINDVLNRHRRAANLPPYRKPDDSFSKTAQISQLVKAFDFPRKSPPRHLHYVGPFQRQSLNPVSFPYERLNGLPLVYASFGTSFGHVLADMRTVVEVCSHLPVQLVISLGGTQLNSDHVAFPPATIAVAYAPQHELLTLAAIVITHAGLNTTMEAVSQGVPLLAMPIAGDQFGVSARLSWHGAGLVLYRGHRSAAKVKAAIQSLLEHSRWKARAQKLGDAIGQCRGSADAAAIVCSAAEGQ